MRRKTAALVVLVIATCLLVSFYYYQIRRALKLREETKITIEVVSEKSIFSDKETLFSLVKTRTNYSTLENSRIESGFQINKYIKDLDNQDWRLDQQLNFPEYIWNEFLQFNHSKM